MDYDVIIIGCGPAGMSAGIYTGRLGLKVAIFESKDYGGNMALASIIENYPGYTKTSGIELTKKMLEQTKNAGAEIINDGIVRIEKKDKIFEVTTNENKSHISKAIIIATGGEYRKLGIEGEEDFLGKGVSYCPHCDGPLFKDKNVVVVGGGDTAVTGAAYLADIVKNVYVVHKRDEFRAEDSNVKSLDQKKNVQLFLNYIPLKIEGDEIVKSLRIQSISTGEEKSLVADCIFVCVGDIPLVTLTQSIGVNINEKGAIITDRNQQTNVKGIFAAGDVTGGFRQIITAAAEGTTAAINAFQYIKSKEVTSYVK